MNLLDVRFAGLYGLEELDLGSAEEDQVGGDGVVGGEEEVKGEEPGDDELYRIVICQVSAVSVGPGKQREEYSRPTS